MNTGLRVWDRQGNIIADITSRYPKLIDNITITTDTDKTIHYTAPNGYTLLVLPVYLSRNDMTRQTHTAVDEADNDHYTYNLWQADIEYLPTGFRIIAKASNNEQRVPIKIYWGYI